MTNEEKTNTDALRRVIHGYSRDLIRVRERRCRWRARYFGALMMLGAAASENRRLRGEHDLVETMFTGEVADLERKLAETRRTLQQLRDRCRWARLILLATITFCVAVLIALRAGWVA